MGSIILDVLYDFLFSILILDVLYDFGMMLLDD